MFQVLVGERVELSCGVNTTQCGPYHSVKWYYCSNQL